MKSTRIKINNKEKQFAAGNWGSNKFVKKHTMIANPLIPEKTRGKGLKRRKRVKKPRILPWSICPFCGKKLEELAKSTTFILNDYAKKCSHCGAKETPQCPACKRETWVNKEGLYKHKWFGCGFTGKKKHPHKKPHK